MSRTTVDRLRWAVELLDVGPGDRILELGCGPGVAVALICERLDGGRVTAVDRSRTAIERATRRNAGHVAAGKARLVCLDVADAGHLGGPYDKVFAVNVNLFWTGRADAELEAVLGLMHPAATLYLVYETPPGTTASRIAETVTAVLTERHFVTTTTNRTESLICVTARPG